MDERIEYCSNCGTDVPENYVFCIQDGDDHCRHITELVEEGLLAF